MLLVPIDLRLSDFRAYLQLPGSKSVQSREAFDKAHRFWKLHRWAAGRNFRIVGACIAFLLHRVLVLPVGGVSVSLGSMYTRGCTALDEQDSTKSRQVLASFQS